MKYCIVTGGVISGIGKGVISSSIAFILKAHGQRVTTIKIDPYLNIDAGTLSPYEHGECFVLNDGGEVDPDLGNYERFVDISLTRDNNITTGKIYERVIMKERRGDFLGKTVQVVPHITNEIQEWIERVAHIPVDTPGQTPDICVIELGGTIGDIESAPFVEALRQLSYRVEPNAFMLFHVSLLPTIGDSGQQKTKPTQHSIRELRGLGLIPDVILCRSTATFDESLKGKLCIFCQVPPEAVLSVPDSPSLYNVPLILINQNILSLIEKKFSLPPVAPTPPSLLKGWVALVERSISATDPLHVTIVGKYTKTGSDAYHSLIKALEHATLEANRCLTIHWIEADDLIPPQNSPQLPNSYDIARKTLQKSSAIIVPGGFGERGIEGMIVACQHARVNKIPFLGICLGMQVATIEYARHVLGWSDAHSEEFVGPSTSISKNVIIFMPEIDKTKAGGTMRLGGRRTLLYPIPSIARALYHNQDVIYERHRHRYEINPEFIHFFEEADLKFVGRDETNSRMEILEIQNHPFFLGTQYHPEYITRPLLPNPIFHGFVQAAIGNFIPPL